MCILSEMERLKLISDHFFLNRDTVEFVDGSYQEVTAHADSRSILFKAKAKNTWKSKPLSSVVKKVQGLTQKLTRLYDCNRDIYTFQNTSESYYINVKKALSAPPVWKGNELTPSEIMDLCDALIDTVTNLLIF